MARVAYFSRNTHGGHEFLEKYVDLQGTNAQNTSHSHMLKPTPTRLQPQCLRTLKRCCGSSPVHIEKADVHETVSTTRVLEPMCKIHVPQQHFASRFSRDTCRSSISSADVHCVQGIQEQKKTQFHKHICKPHPRRSGSTNNMR